jgi:hypothetical protein
MIGVEHEAGLVADAGNMLNVSSTPPQRNESGSFLVELRLRDGVRYAAIDTG